MLRHDRRGFLRLFGAGALGAVAAPPVQQALAADPAGASDDFFVFVHCSGGWDVTLWSDPRTETTPVIDPPSTEFVDTALLRRWVDAPLDGTVKTFEPIVRGGLRFGPAIGDLADLADRLTIVNGVAMNTVSHPDGTYFSSTGRHLAGGRPVGSSADVCVADALGTAQLFPAVSFRYPTAYVGSAHDPRALPLVVDAVGTIAKTLTRVNSTTNAADRDAVHALLSREALALRGSSHGTTAVNGYAVQVETLRKMFGGSLGPLFDVTALRAANFTAATYAGRFQGGSAVNFSFAIEAMKRNVVRSISLTCGGFDTHNTNYRTHGQNLQETFDLLAAFVRALDAAPHPTRAGARLSDHVHVVVTSDFCRTPGINPTGGRDHYPNNTTLVISPKFRGGTTFSRTRSGDLLPENAGTFSDGARPIAPPDILATLLHSAGVDPRRYLRDGEVVRGLLKVT
jgi:uncharacterized protein (DUF1501 family)